MAIVWPIAYCSDYVALYPPDRMPRKIHNQLYREHEGATEWTIQNGLLLRASTGAVMAEHNTRRLWDNTQGQSHRSSGITERLWW